MELEKHLVLNKFFLNLFGFNKFDDLRNNLRRKSQEGYDTLGRSYFIDTLIGLKPEWENLLLRYDEAIREYIEKLRQNRNQPDFNLKYFQYLAVLFSEIFLDKYYNNEMSFLNELNEFLGKFNIENRTEISFFTEEDIKKLAFWMATGSGKTLIMHINYWQILKYSKDNWDNIILITPNEGLSKQHYEELRLSGIPSKLYDGNLDNLNTKNGEILVIDIHKLTKEKKGEGVSVDISYFDGKNLVFIDEGHKGAGGENETGWKSLREKIAKEGFSFEYSATFGQIIEFTKSGQPKGGKSNKTNIELYNEYTKSIIFNYSYKYFYEDGYGKDFYVYNIKEDAYTETHRDLLLTAGLLSFYEQLTIFEKHREELREYNIEKPLWIFVGSKVAGKGINSDVARVIQFIDKVIKDETWLKENVIKILGGKSGLIDNEGNDIFTGKFEFIRRLAIDEIVEGIYKKVFAGKGRLELYEIKNAEGEIGLKTTTGEKYFGVINVGDVRSLKKLIKESNIEVKEDHFSQSLFFRINESNSYINILIGSKKFVEGWNSWRVSNMGLINMGKGEGPQIIQLFGRGVRLKGKDYSLKREENSDYKLKALQTLYIFGLNANYINNFLSAFDEEDVRYIDIEIPIRFNELEKWENEICTLRLSDDFDFLEEPLILSHENALYDIDLRSKITIAKGIKTEQVSASVDKPIKIPDNYFNLIDWNNIYSEIMNYKIEKSWYNLIVDRDVLKKIVTEKTFKIFLNETEGIAIKENNEIEINSFEGVKKLNDIILRVLKKYIDKFYKKMKRKEETNNLKVEYLNAEKHKNMFPENMKITIKIPEKLKKDIDALQNQLINYDENSLPEEWSDWDSSFVIHFDKHLYTPLVIWKKNKEEIKSLPVKLNKGETEFIEDLREYLKKEGKFADKDLFLLRNLSRKGIGFFEESGFYPDFILWIKYENNQYHYQHMVFLDSKGIRNLANFEDDKIKFCDYIRGIEKSIKEKLNEECKDLNLTLSAFIISVSESNNIKEIWDNGKFRNSDFKTIKEEFYKHNVLFIEDKPDYLDKIFEKVTPST